MHLLPTLACLVGAALMLAGSRSVPTVVAHGLMFVAMAVMGLAMAQWAFALVVVAVLCLVGVAMVRHGDEGHRATAIDSFGCAALVGLTTVAMLTRTAAHTMGDHVMGDHVMGDVMAPAVSPWSTVALLGVVVAVGAWFAATVIATPRRSLLGWGAGAAMMLGMGAMALA